MCSAVETAVVDAVVEAVVVVLLLTETDVVDELLADLVVVEDDELEVLTAAGSVLVVDHCSQPFGDATAMAAKPRIADVENFILIVFGD